MLNLAQLPSRSDLTDGSLVERVVAGDTALFAVLLRRYNQQLYRAVRAILRDEFEAEDALQQAYLAAFRHLGSFEGKACVGTWLTRIAINEALARRRRQVRVRAIEDALESQPPPANRHPDDATMRRQFVRFVEDAIDELPDAYRVVVMLRDIQEMSTIEVAESLGLSEGNVRVRLHRGRALLREALREWVEPNEPFPFLGRRCDRMVRCVMTLLLEDRPSTTPPL